VLGLLQDGSKRWTRDAGAHVRRGGLERPGLPGRLRSVRRQIRQPVGIGPAARAEPIRRYHQAFPDLHLDIEELIVAGDTVVLRAAFRGTDTGGYAGRAATGRAVDEWVVTIMHFDGDRVVREWSGADKLGLFIQLGVLDNPWPG
jgi:predicted ester cyclase